MSALIARIVRPFHGRGQIADAVLAGLLIGPLAAPFLQAWGIFAPRTVSEIIYTMGMFVCPQPAYGVALYDSQIMAVCMRCYGTVLGVLLTRLLHAADGGASRFWLPRYGMWGPPIFAVMIFTYVAEFASQIAGWWDFNHLIVTVAGLITGAGLGLMFHPVLQGQRSPNTNATAPAFDRRF